VSRVTVALLCLALGACRDRWRERADPSRTTNEPEQAAIAAAETISFEKNGYRVTLRPRADYRVAGYALETSTTLLDRWDFAMPIDVALAWGPAADPRALKHLKTHLSRRYLSFWYSGSDPAFGIVQRHISNHHLIPADGATEKALRRIREGTLVTLRGKLVDVEIADREGRTRFKSPTSLSRDDAGSGACEQVWVQDVDIER
jgi:hypothetical protein